MHNTSAFFCHAESQTDDEGTINLLSDRSVWGTRSPDTFDYGEHFADASAQTDTFTDDNIAENSVAADENDAEEHVLVTSCAVDGIYDSGWGNSNTLNHLQEKPAASTIAAEPVPYAAPAATTVALAVPTTANVSAPAAEQAIEEPVTHAAPDAEEAVTHDGRALDSLVLVPVLGRVVLFSEDDPDICRALSVPTRGGSANIPVACCTATLRTACMRLALLASPVRDALAQVGMPATANVGEAAHVVDDEAKATDRVSPWGKVCTAEHAASAKDVDIDPDSVGIDPESWRRVGSHAHESLLELRVLQLETVAAACDLAAVAVQCAYRGHLLRLRYTAMRKDGDRKTAATYIQHWWHWCDTCWKIGALADIRDNLKASTASEAIQHQAHEIDTKINRLCHYRDTPVPPVHHEWFVFTRAVKATLSTSP